MAGIRDPRTRDPGLPAAGRRGFTDKGAEAMEAPRFNAIFDAADRFGLLICARFVEAASLRCEAEGVWAFALRLALSFTSTGVVFRE